MKRLLSPPGRGAAGNRELAAGRSAGGEGAPEDRAGGKGGWPRRRVAARPGLGEHGGKGGQNRGEDLQAGGRAGLPSVRVIDEGKVVGPNAGRRRKDQCREREQGHRKRRYPGNAGGTRA